MTLVLEVEGLEAFYGRAQVLFGVSLRIGEGEVVALLGRNGAGKSTTMKAIMGLLPEVRGRRRFRGQDISTWACHSIARAGLGYVPEERRIFTELTVEENLEVGRQPPREAVPHWTPDRLFDLFPNLRDLRRRPGGQMSGGEQQMLSIARTLMGNPSTILLDEPSEGLAPVIVQQMAQMIGRLKREGLTVLLSEQNLGFAAGVADRAYVIESGHIRFEGAMKTLLDNSELRRTYLGV